MDKTIGLAYRAKKIVLGTDQTIDHLRKHKICLVVLAHDASLLTKKKINDKAKFYKTNVIQDLSALELSSALGKKDVKVIGIKDEGFCRLLMDKRRK